MNGDSEANCLRREMIDTAVEHYELLTEAYNINNKIKDRSNDAWGSAGKLLKTLQSTQKSAEVLVESGKAWRQESQLCRHAAAHHAVLLVVAEAPALLEEAVQQEMYTEVLELIRYIQRLATNTSNVDGGAVNRRSDDDVDDNEIHLTEYDSADGGGRVALLDSLWDRTISALQQSLITTVLPRLCRLSLSVESVFRIMQFFRLLSPNAPALFLEELFLTCRELYVQHLIEEARTEFPQPSQRAKRYLQIYRGPMSEVVLQYKACFVSRSASASHSGMSSGGQEDVKEGSLKRIAQQEQGSEAFLLSQWCRKRGEELQDVVAKVLEEISNSYELGELWEEAHAACISAARTQFSLWPILSALIVNHVATLFCHHIEEAKIAYEESMKTFSWKPSSSSSKGGYAHLLSFGSRASPSATTSNASPFCGVKPSFSSPYYTGSQSFGVGSSGRVTDLIPPGRLMDFPPLALALNEFINGVNVIHRLILPGISSFCAREVSELLRYISVDLSRDAELVIGAGEDTRKSFIAVLYSFEKLFLPHVCQCMNLLFGEETALQLEREVLLVLSPVCATVDDYVSSTTKGVTPLASTTSTKNSTLAEKSHTNDLIAPPHVKA